MLRRLNIGEITSDDRNDCLVSVFIRWEPYISLLMVFLSFVVECHLHS